MAWEATGTIDRKEFGMTWSRALDGGGLVVGDDVDIELAIQGVAE
jgi:polyisoprenoid-binding protein YceI